MTAIDAHSTLLGRLERYYDTVPRAAARVEEYGSLTLFVREGPGWPYYARPALRPDAPPPSAADVREVCARLRELGLPEAFEWVAETTPGMRAAVEAAGLRVSAHPLMARDASAPVPEPHPRVRVLGAQDPFLAAALALPHVAFAHPGTATGPAGAAELTAEITARAGDGSVPHHQDRIRSGRTVLAAAVEDGVVLCSGMHLPVGDVTEIAGVGTLPAARRRGFGLAVTGTLVTHALAAGISTVFLSAGDDEVARIYARLGFHPVGTALIAQPATA
ncbi:GNAT family N-acetyltransferase [Streptomyces kunmingensis]|uniref:GNAT family N-acetyltransferase n=1 Tax=Streptomyces kunmingensis TaxID=68225 RepID=A0ABU6CJX4_9ACTN|nr:GNAT family N-acetyltransferase [Streptomyces kunmingensis]MEB3964536.1 GNAT family N-acetyltransferase [Streptomyces kunmingensis]